MGNYQVRFLGESGAATPRTYPIGIFEKKHLGEAQKFGEIQSVKEQKADS